MCNEKVAFATLGMHTMDRDILIVMMNECLIIAILAHDCVDLVHEFLDATDTTFGCLNLDRSAIRVRRCV